MSNDNDNEDLRAEVIRLRAQVNKLESQMDMVADVFRMLDHDMQDFCPRMREEFIDHLQTIHSIATGEDDHGAALLRRIADDVTKIPKSLGNRYGG